MPLGLRLPLFARSKTTSSSASSEHDSTANTAVNSAVNSASSISDLRKNTSLLHRRRGRSKSSATSRVPVATENTTDSIRVPSISPPATSPEFGADSTLLGSVGEEKEESEPVDIVQDNAINSGNSRPALVLQAATPPSVDTELIVSKHAIPRSPLGAEASPFQPRTADNLSIADSIAVSSNASPRHISPRRPSLVDSANATVASQKPRMPRKIWVKRPNASATLVQIKEDDLVDDVRDMILRKYANSLGRTFDAPDMTIRIVPRAEAAAGRPDRLLGPEEEICRIIESTYPGGQTVEEALLIITPVQKTPKPSPRAYTHHPITAYSHHDYEVMEGPKDYFSVPFSQPGLPGHGHSLGGHDHPKSMAVLTTGALPQLPISPGSTRRTQHRPKPIRGHTSSPTIVQPGIPPNMMPIRQNRARVESSASETHRAINGATHLPALPTPPIPEIPHAGKGSTPPTPAMPAAILNPRGQLKQRKTTRPTPKKSSTRPSRHRRGSGEGIANGLPGISNMLEGIVPPINVLIVEDNIINLRVLEALMKRLKVRWSTAVNGKIAVDKWKTGGYHLILMDIQMPVMNGLQATKEIRRLEKVNGIGVFSSSAPSSPEEKRARRKEYIDGPDTEGDSTETDPEPIVKRDPAADKLTITQGNFKSPIIIVALTASSLQSDRHEALAAGCNDFLTKPVQGSWLERKVKEWGCMQALIDFDGWKRWRDINEKEEAKKSDEQKEQEKAKEEKAKKKLALLEKMQGRPAGKSVAATPVVEVNGA